MITEWDRKSFKNLLFTLYVSELQPHSVTNSNSSRFIVVFPEVQQQWSNEFSFHQDAQLVQQLAVERAALTHQADLISAQRSAVRLAMRSAHRSVSARLLDHEHGSGYNQL